MAPFVQQDCYGGAVGELFMRKCIILGLGLAASAPALAQTPAVAIGDTPAAQRCETLPMSGAGSATGGNGVLTIGGRERGRTLELDGRPAQRLGRDVASASLRAACRSGSRDYYLLALSVPSRDRSCPLRYQAVEIGPDRLAKASQRFGSCADGATAGLAGGVFTIAMPGSAGAPAVSYRYQGGQIVPLGAAPVVAAAPPPRERRRGRDRYRLAAWTAPPACAVVMRTEPLRSEVRSADVLLADFRRDWPRDWSSRSRLRNQPFDAAGLRAVVTDLACLSVLPGGERVVVRAARPLFESGRHGTAAFEQLDEVARGAGIDGGVRAAARIFHAQMRFEVDRERFR